MVHSGDVGSGRRVRRWRSVAEKRQIVQLMIEPGASVAEVARAYGLNAEPGLQVAAGFGTRRVDRVLFCVAACDGIDSERAGERSRGATV